MNYSQLVLTAFPNAQPSGPNWLNVACPFCSDSPYGPDPGQHLGIEIKKGYTNCFRCGRSDNLKFFLRKFASDFNFEDINVTPEAVKYAREGIELPEDFIPYDRFPYGDSFRGDQALTYIKERIGFRLAEKFKIGYCLKGRFFNRIIIPIYEAGVLVYFLARAFVNNISPKILNPHGSKGDVMFNWDIASKFDEVYLVEGAFGAFNLFPYAVALLGKNPSEEQILRLVRSDVSIINVLMDGNAIKDGYKIADKILELTRRKFIRVIELRQELQPDDLPLSHINRLKTKFNFYRGLRSGYKF